MNRELVKMQFNIFKRYPIIRLFGARRKNMPIEYMYYYSSNYDNNQNQIIRVNKGGTCRLVAVCNGVYFFRWCNLPFAILFGDII